MKVRDLLGVARSNMVFWVEYRCGNREVCTGLNNCHEIDRVFGGREVDNWFPRSGLAGGICIDMAQQEEEKNDEAD